MTIWSAVAADDTAAGSWPRRASTRTPTASPLNAYGFAPGALSGPTAFSAPSPRPRGPDASVERLAGEPPRQSDSTMDMHDHPSLPLDAGSSGDSSRRTGKTGRAAAREVVAFALAAGQTQAEGAAKGGVSVRTVRSWSGESEFAARVEQLRAEAIGQALGRLSGTMSSAADVLKDLLQSKSEDVRLRASRA